MEEDSVFNIWVRSTDPMNGYFEQEFTLHEEIVTSIDPNHLSNSIKIYPNPTSGTVEIKVSRKQNQPLKLILLSVGGEILEIKEFADGENLTFDLSGMSNGVYFMQIEQGDTVIIKKVVKK